MHLINLIPAAIILAMLFAVMAVYFRRAVRVRTELLALQEKYLRAAEQQAAALERIASAIEAYKPPQSN